MLNSISRLGETGREQEWSNGTEFSGYSDFPEKRVHSKRIPKFSKTFPGIFTVPFNFGPEISGFLAEWKAPVVPFSRWKFSDGTACSISLQNRRLSPRTQLALRARLAFAPVPLTTQKITPVLQAMFHLRVSQRFTSSTPLTTISSAMPKYGGYSLS